ncbi:MAG: hypothetical protein OSB30_04830 [Candidatus Poseidoniaceae archaeon]|nr:hypothetical protein [Candidatus Poseidoniaceae archaeon]
MVSAGTLHVVTTELVVGTFALAGLCFGLKLLYSFKLLSNNKANDALDSIAHGALLFGLLSLPFAILSGINSAGVNDGGFMSAILVNKLWLSFSGFGLAIGVLISRWKVGSSIWDETKTSLTQSSFGMAACGAILLTASAGGKFARGESLLDMLHLPYDLILLMPIWLSVLLLLSGLTNLVIGIRANSSQ